MNKDQVKGLFNEVKGELKVLTGKVLGNKKLEAKGEAQKTAGKVQTTYGDNKNDIVKDK